MLSIVKHPHHAESSLLNKYYISVNVFFVICHNALTIHNVQCPVTITKPKMELHHAMFSNLQPLPYRLQSCVSLRAGRTAQAGATS